MKYNVSDEQKIIKFLDFNSVNYEAINFALNLIDWNALFYNVDIDTAIERFHVVINDVINEFVPIKTKKIDDYPPWFDNNLKSLISQKKKLHRLFKCTSFFFFTVTSEDLFLTTL